MRKQEVFYLANSRVKNINVHAFDSGDYKNNFGFDDKNGNYIISLGDQIEYRYEIKRVLGTGSFGNVVLCVDHKYSTPEKQRKVAIKIIRNDLNWSLQAVSEIKMLKQLSQSSKDVMNDHIMSYYDHFHFRGHMCIATEVLSLNLFTLLELMSFRGLTLDLLKKFAIDILRGLNFVHEQKVIHCDVKPENIMIKLPLDYDPHDGSLPTEFTVKLIDFGSSCFENDTSYSYIQSRFYRAPEVILGSKYSSKIDIWSLGCVLAEIFTGAPILPGKSEVEQIALILELFGAPPASHIVNEKKKLLRMARVSSSKIRDPVVAESSVYGSDVKAPIDEKKIKRTLLYSLFNAEGKVNLQFINQLLISNGKESNGNGHVKKSVKLNLRSLSVTIFMSTSPPAKGSRRSRVLNSLYNYTSDMAEAHAGKNRGIAAGTAATILGMGLEHVEKTADGGVRAKDGSFEYTEEELEAVREMALSAEEHQAAKEPTHFMDRFMERLISHTVPQDNPDYHEINTRIKDPSRKNKAPLSIRKLGSNMKRLSSKMGSFFKLQYGVIHVITWKQPTKTLSVLVLYTAICMWPHLVVALPLLVLLFGVIVPAYLHRHPMNIPELVKTKKRGQSLLEFFNQSEDESVVMDLLNDRSEEFSDDMSTATFSSEYSRATTATTATTATGATNASAFAQKGLNAAASVSSENQSKFVKSQVSTFMNMRDLQNLTTDLLNGIDHAEKVATDIVGFKNERLTTFIFYILTFVTSVVLFVGRWIPWRIIFIQAGWIGMIVCHPNAKKYIQALKKKRQPPPVVEDDGEETEDEDAEEQPPKRLPHETFDRPDIIVDDAPEVRIAEIYELQIRNILKHEWKLYGYSKRLFDYADKVRVSGKKPHGVDSIGKILPPKEWKFDFGFASNWQVDRNPEQFIRVRGVDKTHLKIKDDEKEGWVYDKLPAAQDSTIEFRRRRLYRECFRYARPVNNKVL
ncbi:hypothetical protein C7M61_001171 [Candidozyma pseudohaemuli]|uniref:Protein kinase domain-containing protein n=1 Tax=Candidozyma pseudohaemuli TaxID=418784 RepID=A0A2P7YZX1_9ASCO|nr:hypothetical protein C7M61_001171 [[Candida] pseudohaemulonii]PSK41488.1 hypothetical protein C7M61_001171 [[Candida] pseudohaemulonii]